VLLGYDLYKAASIGNASVATVDRRRSTTCSRVLFTDPYYDPRRVREATSEPSPNTSAAVEPAIPFRSSRRSCARGRELRELFTLDVQPRARGSRSLAELARQLPHHATRGAPHARQLLVVHTPPGGYLLAAQGDRH